MHDILDFFKCQLKDIYYNNTDFPVHVEDIVDCRRFMVLQTMLKTFLLV